MVRSLGIESLDFFSKIILLLALLSLAACSVGGGADPGPSRAPIASYCPYLPSKTFSSPVTVTGAAYYEYRSNGNGPVSDGVHTFTPTASTPQTYGLTINGTAANYVCAAACTAANVVSTLTATINGGSFAVTASGSSTLILTPKNEGDTIAYTSLNFLSDTAESYSSPNNIVHADPNPIRYAEVQVTDSGGSIVQCAETSSTGTFSFQLPSGGASYTVSVLSRANNSANTAYIMNNPTDNTAYKISSTVTATGSPTVRLVAKATGNLYGGAFNILDQIYKAQNYIRTQTANCSATSGLSDCVPFTTAPVVNTYWTPGLTPAVYQGGTGGISFYGSPDGSAAMKGLYILGGINGDTDNSDMDHYDNSVIVHEYGHFIEDNFGRMDSPGGSHNGNSLIDPRLAWGEGWADFHQAAVLSFYKVDGTPCGGTGCGNGYYRDTYGHVGCTGSNGQGLPGCSGVTFNEDVSVDPGSCSGCHDKPDTADTNNPRGEGNFREFSIARILYKAAKSGGTSTFQEVWTVLNGGSLGMKPSSDRFKTIGRFHTIQRAINPTLWDTLRLNESQYGDLGDYATPYTTSGCASTSRTMNIRVVGSDSGTFATSDQMRNNDFITLTWPGGSGSFSISWSGGTVADLDLYLYPQGYVYGQGWTAASRADSNTTSGSESISGSFAAGNYLLNVMAYTARVSSSTPNAPYTATGNYNTNYTLTINGTATCSSFTKDSARP